MRQRSNRRSRGVRPRAVTGLVVACLMAAAGSGLAPAAGARSEGRAAAVARCTSNQTQVWLGLGLGGGTAGTYYYPLEFSNIGRRACTLYGYPGVSAFGASGRRLGTPATRNTGSPGVVTLTPGATAHALLGIHDAGALCAHPASAQGLRVYPPAQTASRVIEFGFQACTQRGVLVVGPVRAGVGIPGYSTR